MTKSQLNKNIYLKAVVFIEKTELIPSKLSKREKLIFLNTSLSLVVINPYSVTL